MKIVGMPHEEHSEAMSGTLVPQRGHFMAAGGDQSRPYDKNGHDILPV
jgi:hypothetical protein